MERAPQPFEARLHDIEVVVCVCVRVFLCFVLTGLAADVNEASCLRIILIMSSLPRPYLFVANSSFLFLFLFFLIPAAARDFNVASPGQTSAHFVR